MRNTFLKIMLIVLISVIIVTIVSISIFNTRNEEPIIYSNFGYSFEIPVPSGAVHDKMGGTCVFTFDYLKTKKSIDHFYEKEIVYAENNYLYCGENAGYRIYYNEDKSTHILLSTEYSLTKHRLIFTRLRICFAIDADHDELAKYIEGCKH